MGKSENDFLKELLATFRIEAAEHLKAITSGLIELENTSTAEEQTAIIEPVFRAAHSLKGAARAVDLADIEAICQALESVFSALKREEVTPSSELFDALHHAVDTVDALLASDKEIKYAEIAAIIEQLANLQFGEPEGEGQPSLDLDSPSDETESPPFQEIVQQYSPEVSSTKEEHPDNTEETHAAPAPEVDSSTSRTYQLDKEKSTLSETVRISTAKLDSLLLQVEEMLAVKQAANHYAADLRNTKATLDLWKKKWAKLAPGVRAIRQLIEKNNRDEQGQTKSPSIQNVRQSKKSLPIIPDMDLVKMFDFLDWHQANVELFENRLTALTKSAEQNYRSLNIMLNNLLEDVKKILMLPFSSLLEIFPKMVRDLSRDGGKEVDLALEGGEIEIDRRILEEMKDPLIHLLRNCIDHGIEKPEERQRHQKPRRGTITVAASQVDSSKVEVLVSDDGAGINPAQLKEVAIKRGVISQDEVAKLSERETLALIFQSGFSTSLMVTDISGRGLGLAIVQERVEKLGGNILPVETAPNIGTSFRILLPVTLATFRGILVRAAEQLFIIPASNVERVMRINRDEIKTVENRETVKLNGRIVSFVQLDDVLELPRRERPNGGSRKADSKLLPVLVLGAAEKRIAFGVEEILHEQEVLVKGLGRQLSRVRNIAGATILGSGKVVPILNVSDLMKSAARNASAPVRAVAAAEEADAERKSILVAEDSITSRTLLKNILASAGYQVKTAVDGADAFAALKTENFDLVVSDVDMPRMNGFDLTSKIRSDREFSELPVVLVTSLESREHKERGIDAGANAYIVKSSFDQSNLLEVVRRLI